MTIVGYQYPGVSPANSIASAPNERQPLNPRFSGAEQLLSQGIAQTTKRQALGRMSLWNQGLNRFSDLMVPIFQKITEVYIASFLATDVVGLWMPRIWTSAKTGRVECDPSQDPEVRDKPFKEQVKLWITGNVKGLNWGNLQEETAREAATGPGLLVIPSVLYAFSGHALGRTGIHLRHQALNGLCDGFREHLETTPLRQVGADIKLKDYRREMGNYIASIFQDTELRKTPMPNGEGTYGTFLDDWAQRWAHTMEINGDKAARKKQEAAFSQLGAELQEKLVVFNQEHRMQPYNINGKTIGANATDSLLHRADYIWADYGSQGKPQQAPIEQVLKDLTKWADVSRGIYKTQTEKLAGMADVTLPEVIEFVRRKVISHKTLFSVSATLLGAAYLFQLVFWTQRHKSYLATRLLHEDKNAQSGQAAGSSTSTNQQDRPGSSQRQVKQPAFSLSTQGARPVFSMTANAQDGTPQSSMQGGQA